MNNLNSQTTDNQTEQKSRPSEEDLARMKLSLCKNGDNCEYFKRGRCRYSHESGGHVVQHDPRSHKQLPPTKPALPTEADILASILQKGGLSKNVQKYVDRTKSFELLKGFNSMSKLFDDLFSRDSLSAKDIADALSNFKKVADKFPKDLKSLIEFLSTNIDALSAEKKFKKADLQATVQELKTTYEVSSDVSEQLEEYQRQCELHAKTLSLDPLAQARENPDGIPTPEFLNHLANACGLRDNKGFNEMRSSHEELGKNSPYRNKEFLSILSVHEATKEAEKLLEAHRLKEMQERMVAEARAKLLQECLTGGNQNLKIAFRISQSQSEFVIFVQALSHEEHETLVSVFGSFMTYLAQQYKKETQITSEFLSKTFMSFTQSRKVDGSTNAFKTKFFDIVHTDMFKELFDVLHVETSSAHGSQNGSSGTRIMIHEILKYMLKELVDIYGDKVPHDERDDFYKNLVRELLPLAFLISLSPKHSNMLAGRWKKGEKDRQTGQLINHYLKMQGSHEKKSILYWLLMNLNQTKVGKRNQVAESDIFEKLSSQFTYEHQIKKEDGSTETKRIFSPELLFEALRYVQRKNFLKASDFPIKIHNIQDDSLGTLFCVQDESISVSDQCQPELLMAIYYAFGSNERDPHTRQFSDIKALMHMRPELILQVVEMCQTFNPENPSESVLAIINSLGFEGKQSLEIPLLTLLTLISENKSEDLLRKAYDVMSLATTMIEIHEGKDCYFMSLVDALVVVLLTEKFPQVKQFDIVQAVYETKSNPSRKVFINFVTIQNFVAKLGDGDLRKARLTDFLSIGKRSNPDKQQEMQGIVNFLRNILCIHGQQDGSFHDHIKRIFPFLLDRHSLVGLLKTNPEFEIDSSEFSQSQDYSAFMLDKIKALFEKEFMAFMKSQNSKIQQDLKARMEDIKRLPELAERLKALGLTKHASAIANLVNSLFSALALPHRLDAEIFVSSFPKTKGLEQSESADLVCSHVLSVIGIVKPVEPANPANPANAVESKKSKSKKSTSKESKSEADYKASVAKFTLEMERFQMMENIVSRAISAIYRVELPKEEGATFKKVPTIKLSDLRDILLQSTSLADLFGKCLPYWKSPLVRELILFILDHKFKLRDDNVRSLYREIQSFGVSFEPSDISQYTTMFSFLNYPDADLSKTDSYKVSDEYVFELMKKTLESDFWNDSNIEVEISSPVVQRRRMVAIRKRRDDESEMSSGGGPAPEPEVEVEEESVPVVAFDIGQLRTLLANESKDKAIAYMDSLSSRDETEEGILTALKEQDSTCQSVLQAVNQVYPN